MPTCRTCSQCGAELPANAPQGLCAKCLPNSSLKWAFQPNPPPPETPVPDGDNAPDALSGGKAQRIGPYKLLQRLGEGGMGTVWMAEQTEPLRRMVAVKIVKPGMDSNQILARFEAERQVLALMDHPNIAKVLDASPTSPTTRLGTMKTLGFACFVSTTFCFLEFAWAVSGRASPTVYVDVP